MIAVYGASGHTGQFVVRDALRLGLAVTAVARSAARLSEVYGPGVTVREAALEDPAALDRALGGCAVVINCAGPFLDTSKPVAESALRSGCNYIDVTAEQASARAVFADLDAPAKAAGRVLIPAAGFYGGLADLLATALARDGSIDRVTVAVALDRWWPTAGTRRTGERNTAPRVVLREGSLVPLQASAGDLEWRFSPPIGAQAMVEVPFSEVITMAHHLPIRETRSLFGRAALDDIRNAATPPPTAVDGMGRSAQRFEIVVRLEQHGEVRTAGARGQDIYAVTAPIVVEAARRLQDAGNRRSGALSLAEATDAKAMLHALHGSAFDVFGAI